MYWMNRYLTRAILLATIAILPSVAQNTAVTKSATEFVRTFYAWYVPLALKSDATETTLRNKPQVLSPELYRALKGYYETEAKSKGETVGLDFDPFLNSQDPCPNFEVGQANARGNRIQVEIYGVCSGKKSEKPDLVAEVTHDHGVWKFTNFLYPTETKADPKSGDLLTILKGIAEDRKRENQPRPK